MLVAGLVECPVRTQGAAMTVWRDPFARCRCPHHSGLRDSARRDAVRAALEHVWTGDLAEEADAVLDQLDDLGYQVVPK